MQSRDSIHAANGIFKVLEIAGKSHFPRQLLHIFRLPFVGIFTIVHRTNPLKLDRSSKYLEISVFSITESAAFNSLAAVFKA